VIDALLAATDAGRTVLVPNAELAAALIDAVERAQRAALREVWPTPSIRDFGGWLREMHFRSQFEDSSTARCLSESEERELWRSVVLESESSRQFLEPGGAARAARRARRAMAEYAIPIEAIAAYRTEESTALLAWNTTFAALCRSLDCMPSDRLLDGAARYLAAREGASAVTWIESPAWRPVARRLLERYAGSPLRAWVSPLSAPPHVLSLDSGAAELAAAAEWSRANLQKDAGFRAWICIPDLGLRREEAADAFDAVLAPRRFSLSLTEDAAPYALAGGTPLAEHSPVRAVLAFLEAAQGEVTFEQFSALLRAPELQLDMAESGAAAKLDWALRTRAPSLYPLGRWLDLADRVAGSEMLGEIAAVRRLRAASRALAVLHGSHPISRWVETWIGAFEAGPWNLRSRWSSGEYQSAERLRELLGELAAGDALFGSQSFHGAAGILQRAARETPFQSQTGVPPIWVSGQVADPWLAYGALWVAGCEEERWPPPVDPIPLLPVRVQVQYGVVPAAVQTQLAFAEDLLRRWLARAPHCVFSVADAEDGRPAQVSPLLSEVSTAPALPEVTRKPLWAVMARSSPSLERLVDEQAPAFGPEERTHGVSTLRAQSRCAFRGFAETRLSTARVERPIPGFDERERGILLHDALERIWGKVGDSARLAALLAQPHELDELLAECVRLAIDKQRARRDPGARWCAREQLRLQNLLRKWLEIEQRRSPFEVEHLEQGKEVARFSGLEFRVRIDRIDRLDEGGRVLIDYKSGTAKADWRGERPDNPQLPIYALLQPHSLVAVAYGQINAVKCGFVDESEHTGIFKSGGRPKFRMEGQENFAQLIELWRKRIERLAAAFAAGRAEVDPTDIACRSCELHGLCRVPSTLDIGDAEEADS
jgi:ATP-dependent helicase/nuclease subunit B